MGRKRRINTLSEHNIAARGKGGFTLAELCIVLAIVAIVSAMIVSFSVSMGDFANSNAEEYDFLEDCAILEEALYKWIAEQDKPGANFDEILPKESIKVQNGTLKIDNNHAVNNLHTITEISFGINDAKNLIKCTITPADSESEKVLVFALRCAIEQGGGE